MGPTALTPKLSPSHDEDMDLAPATPTIVTLTLNPALDLSTSVGWLEPWHKLRCDTIRMDPGGGGVNVARVVKELGGSPIAVVALGGHVGSLLADSLRRSDIDLRRVNVRGVTRQSFSVTARASGEQYRFVAPGAAMTAREWQRCIDATLEAAVGASFVVASSSLPVGVPDDFFVTLANRVDSLGVPLIVDTSGPALERALTANLAFAKPSVRELRMLAHVEVDNVTGYEMAARKVLAASRCETLVVSLGDAGALVVPSDGPSFIVHAPESRIVSAIGAGDSLVAAMALSLARGADLRDAARFGVAAGTAAILREGTSLCCREDVERLLSQTTITEFGQA